MVNQLLAGVHIAAAAEAMAFGARLGLKTRELFEIIMHAGGYSWFVLAFFLSTYLEVFIELSTLLFCISEIKWVDWVLLPITYGKERST